MIRAAGHPLAAVARECGCSRQFLYSIMDGTNEPTWYVGQALNLLYAAVLSTA